MANAVFVVFKSTISAAGIVVFAVCRNRKAAEMARNRIAKCKRALHDGFRFYAKERAAADRADERAVYDKVLQEVAKANGFVKAIEGCEEVS